MQSGLAAGPNAIRSIEAPRVHHAARRRCRCLAGRGARATARVIMIRWDFAPKSVHLSWRERDGPTVKPPAHPGFGRILIERMAGDMFGGTAKLELLPTGAHWSASIPRSFIGGSAA